MQFYHKNMKQSMMMMHSKMKKMPMDIQMNMMEKIMKHMDESKKNQHNPLSIGGYHERF